jgi:glutamyl-Q tRNA(Asp) synthetase
MTRVRAELGPAFEDLHFQEVTAAGTIERKADPAAHGDVVLARKDIGTSYHLASVTDDIEAGVTEVIRGEDLREAAGLHRLLYLLFGAPPPRYRHHQLILDDEGRRLAKRENSPTLQSLREAGVTPAALRKRLGFSQWPADD